MTRARQAAVFAKVLSAVWVDKQHVALQGAPNGFDTRNAMHVAEEAVDRVAALQADVRRVISLVIFLLTNRWGTLLLVGPACFTRRFPFVTAFVDLPPDRVERIMLRWMSHPFRDLHTVARVLKIFAVMTTLSSRNEAGDTLRAAIGYAGKPEQPMPSLTAASHAQEAALQGSIVCGTQVACRAAETGRQPTIAADAASLAAAARAKGMQASDTPSGDDAAIAGRGVDCVISCDVVIVGSGAGGSTVAGVLASAGLKVLVIEKGSYVHPQAIPEWDSEAVAMAYERAFDAVTLDTNIGIVAGSGLGGGTRINWCASFRTPPHVRKEWAEEHGLAFVDSERFTNALDVVCTRLGVHNKPDAGRSHDSSVLTSGLKATSMHCDSIPQNCATPQACSKRCGRGCTSGGRQDAARTWLADAAATGRTMILTRAAALQVVTERASRADESEAERRSRRSVGVLVNLACGEDGGTCRVLVRAGVTVSSAGSLHTPALLLRSGIRGRGNVGRHLRIHPANLALGIMPNGGRSVEDWIDGPMMPTYSRHAARWQEPHKYGPLLSTAVLLPPLLAGCLPFGSAEQYTADAKRLRDMAIMLAYTRDDGPGGRVLLGSDGDPVLKYYPNKSTQARMMDGLITQCRVLRAAGAERIMTMHSTLMAYDVPRCDGPSQTSGDSKTADGPGVDGASVSDDQSAALAKFEQPDSEFEAWLSAVRRRGASPFNLHAFSAHQMGSARMGTDQRTSVVDAQGESWDVRNLFVADASLFPTATGVNPMVTIEALSFCVAENIVERLLGKRPATYAASADKKYEW